MWIAATLAVIAALVFLWPRRSSPEAATGLALPSLPSLPDPAAPSSATSSDDTATALPATAAGGTKLIEVCGIGGVPPDATGAADLAAVAGRRDVLASQRAVLETLRDRDGQVGDAMAIVLELFGGGRDNPAGTPWAALLCASAPSSIMSPVAACAGRNDDRLLATSLIERLARLATATSEPGVYALAMQQCQWVKGDGSCALLNVDQWARLDDGNAAPWLYILQRARDRNDAAQVEEALYHIGAATRYEAEPYAIAGKVAERAGASDIDVVAALVLGEEAIGAGWMRLESFTALTRICTGPTLDDANHQQACEHAAETLTERSDSLSAIVAGASIGRRLGWPVERVNALRGLQLASADEANSTATHSFDLPSSCSGARRILASFSRQAREGEVRTARAWVASHGGSAAFVAPPLRESAPARADEPVQPDPAVRER